LKLALSQLSVVLIFLGAVTIAVGGGATLIGIGGSSGIGANHFDYFGLGWPFCPAVLFWT